MSISRIMTAGLVLAGLSLAGLSGTAHAQLNNTWVGFQNETSTRLVAAPPQGTNDVEEKDFAWGDVDNDGDIDLVSVRKEPFTSPGRRTNVLYINDDGVLVDKTAQYATDTDVVGDQGFLTPTNDRDVVLADFNNDGWLDIATAVTISDGLPKPISHPRIYMNKGAIGGVWQGFRFEQARSPQLYVLLANGLPDMSKPYPGRFCSIAAGDVDGDGDIDIFLGDYDSSGAGGSNEPPGYDINDRLWLNDGNGFFTDSWQTRMNANMLDSAFSAAAAIADMSGDGRPDVIKDTALNAPQYVAIAYNTSGNPAGPFNVFDTPHTFAPYFVSVGDLNNDGRLDMVVTDDNEDRYDLNTGTDALGRAMFPVSRTFSFPTQASYGDDGFGSQSLITDLNNDGWKDVLISDVDVDIGGCGRRLHIYHNLSNPPNVSLREEAQLASANSGWKGAVGLMPSDLSGTYHTAVFDLDGDGDKDLIIGRCTGVWVWTNTTNPCPIVKYGTALPNSTGQIARISTYGSGALANHTLIFNVTNLPSGATGQMVYTKEKKVPCTPYGDGLLCLFRRTKDLPSLGSFVADDSGHARVVVDFADPPFSDVLAGEKRYFQFLYDDPAGGPAGFNLSEAVSVSICQ